MSMKPLTGEAFESLRIAREHYGDDKGKLTAKINVKFFDNAMEVVLPDVVVIELMRLCMPHIVGATHNALQDVIDQGAGFLDAQIEAVQANHAALEARHDDEHEDAVQSDTPHADTSSGGDDIIDDDDAAVLNNNDDDAPPF